MKTRKIIKKAQEEEKREKYQTTDKVLKVQAEEGKKRRKKITSPAVKTEKQGGIQKKTTSITKARPREELNPEAIAKAERNLKVKKETLSTVGMMKRE